MSEKQKLRTKETPESFEEVKTNDDLEISLTISKSSSSAGKFKLLFIILFNA